MKRGEYAAVHTALLDDPDFQRLSPEAKLLWYSLRLMLGASGIALVRGWKTVLPEVTGIDSVNGHLEELTSGGWLNQQQNVLWLRNVLRFNPNLNLSHDKHLTGVSKHIAGLPKLAIVNAFAEYYDLEEPFPGLGTEWDSNGTR